MIQKLADVRSFDDLNALYEYQSLIRTKDKIKFLKAKLFPIAIHYDKKVDGAVILADMEEYILTQHGHC